MPENIHEKLMRKLLERSNYKLVNVPVAKNEQNKIIAVDSNQYTTLMDPQTGRTFQLPKSITDPPNLSGNTSNGMPNPRFNETYMGGLIEKWIDTLPRVKTLKSSNSNPSPNSVPNSSSNNASNSSIIASPAFSNRALSTVSGDAMDSDNTSIAASQVQSSQPSYASGRFPQTRSKIKEGLHYVSPEDYAKECHPLPSPTKLNADIQFADNLHLAMQNDILPRGANPLDDYLGSQQDTRMAIYLSATIDHQGWLDQLCDLDKYLLRYKDNLSVIALRATLSEKCKLNVRNPVKAIPILDQFKIMRAQLERAEKAARDANTVVPDTNPWTALTDDEDTMRLGG